MSINSILHHHQQVDFWFVVMDNFNALLHALPQELYDRIFALTFTTHETSHAIDETYIPPSSLHVSQLTRQQFAKSYYGDGSIFYISRLAVQNFLSCLPLEHRLILNINSELRVFDAEVHLEKGYMMQGCGEEWAILKSLHDASIGLFDIVKFRNIYSDGAWKWVSFWQLMKSELDF